MVLLSEIGHTLNHPAQQGSQAAQHAADAKMELLHTDFYGRLEWSLNTSQAP